MIYGKYQKDRIDVDGEGKKVWEQDANELRDNKKAECTEALWAKKKRLKIPVE